MSDQDFNFAPPPPRRERKEFEPPPWEKDEFDRLAKERGSEPTVPEVVTPEPVPETPVVPEEVPPSSPAPAAVDSEVTGSEPGQPGETAQLADAQVAAMLFELRAEEGPANQVYAKVALIAGALLLFIGIVMVIWAFVMIVIALQRSGQGRNGVFIGLTLLLFGAGFTGTGAWFVFKTLRQQGVL